MRALATLRSPARRVSMARSRRILLSSLLGSRPLSSARLDVQYANRETKSHGHLSTTVTQQAQPLPREASEALDCGCDGSSGRSRCLEPGSAIFPRERRDKTSAHLVSGHALIRLGFWAALGIVRATGLALCCIGAYARPRSSISASEANCEIGRIDPPRGALAPRFAIHGSSIAPIARIDCKPTYDVT